MDTSQIFVDMARQAREFAEMCDRVANESNAVKEDPEAWRERNRQRQAAGVKFEWFNEGIWRHGYKGSIFTFDIGGEEDYREVQEDPDAEGWPKGMAGVDLWREESRKKQAAGVKFEKKFLDGSWRFGEWDFIEKKEDYREVPQPIPHAAERALPKPTKLTARIARCGIHHGYIKTQDWEFYGTPEEYRAECGKYGYAVVSEIKEMVEKPKTVKRYMAMLKYKTDPPFSCVMDSCHTITLYATRKGYNIIGNIEEREVPIE